MIHLDTLHALLDDIFAAAADETVADMTISQLASSAGLAYTTVLKLYHRTTREPRYSTVYKLAKAVGMDLVLFNEALGVVTKTRHRRRRRSA